MGLIPKIAIPAYAKNSLTVKEDTGTYNAGTNPGGFGAPNPVTGDIQGILLTYFKFLATTTTYSDTTTYAALAAGFTKAVPFEDGVWRIRALYQVIPGGAAPAVTWTPGTTQILLTNADTILADTNITSVMITSLGTDVVLEIDRSKPITSTSFYVQSVVTGTGTGSLWVAYQALAYHKVQTGVDECLVQKIGKNALKMFQEDTRCCGELMDITNRLYAAGVFFTEGNYQAADEMLRELYNYCSVNCNC